MAEQRLKIVEKDGVCFLSGVLNEYSDFSLLRSQAAPLRLNMQKISRLNSIGIRNLLKFLTEWGAKPFSYEQCPSEFVDQINMIPALLGTAQQGEVRSLYVPFQCSSCDHEEEVLAQAEDFRSFADGGAAPSRLCNKCKSTMTVLSDSFFSFLNP